MPTLTGIVAAEPCTITGKTMHALQAPATAQTLALLGSAVHYGAACSSPPTAACPPAGTTTEAENGGARAAGPEGMAMSRTASDASMEEEEGEEEPLPASHSHVGPDLGALHDALDHPPAIVDMQVRAHPRRCRKGCGGSVCALGASKVLSAVALLQGGDGHRAVPCMGGQWGAV